MSTELQDASTSPQVIDATGGLTATGQQGRSMEIPARIGDRHAFAHERVLVYIALETRLEGAVRCSKREVAEMLNVNMRTVDRAMMRLRASGEIESTPRHNGSGAQIGNEYRATQKGFEHADSLIARAFAVTN